MTENRFDQFFKGRLHDMPSDVPSDMWQRIEQERRKDRRRLLFGKPRLLACLLLAALLAAGGYYLWSEHSVSAVAKGISDRSTLIAKEKKTGKEHTVKERAATTAGKGFANTPRTNEAASIYIANKPATGNRKKLILENEDQIQKNEFQAGENDNPSDDAASMTTGSSTGHSDVMDPKKKESSARRVPVKKSVDSAKPVSIGIKKMDSVKRDHWALDLYVSPDWLIDNIGAQDPAIRYFEQNNHRMQFSYSIGFRVSRSFGPHFALRSGLQYSVINQRYAFDSLMIPTARFPLERVGSLDLPVLLSYEMGNDQSRAAINAGALVNLYSSVPSDNNFNGYRSKLGPSLYLGLYISQRLNRTTFLFAEPHLQYRLNNMIRDGYEFSQRIHSVGVLLGVRYTMARYPPKK